MNAEISLRTYVQARTQLSNSQKNKPDHVGLGQWPLLSTAQPVGWYEPESAERLIEIRVECHAIARLRPSCPGVFLRSAKALPTPSSARDTDELLPMCNLHCRALLDSKDKYHIPETHHLHPKVVMRSLVRRHGNAAVIHQSSQSLFGSRLHRYSHSPMPASIIETEA